MRDDERFEIERAFDLLPHVVGASWATLWFRLSGVRSPSAREFREKSIEYFEMVGALGGSFPEGEGFEELSRFIRWRTDREVGRIRDGLNEEVEKRHRRYVDYG